MAKTPEEIMAPKAALPGMSQYVYSAAEVDEMVAAVWAPAIAADAALPYPERKRGGEVAAQMKALGVGDGQMMDAITRFRAASAPVVAQKAVIVAPKATKATGLYYGRCSCGCGATRECSDP